MLVRELLPGLQCYYISSYTRAGCKGRFTETIISPHTSSGNLSFHFQTGERVPREKAVCQKQRCTDH